MTGTEQIDVVVVGAGLAGLTAGIRAAEADLRVRVIEQSTDEAYLCNSRYTGGLFHIAMEDMTGDAAWVRANIERATRGEGNGELATALASNAKRTLIWLKQQGVRFITAGPDGLRRNSLAPPGVRQTGLHWQGRAGDVMLRTLADALRRRSGTLTRGVAAQSLVMEDGRCVGVRVLENGQASEIRARSVVLADGGFQANADLVKRFISPAPDRLLMRNARTGQGSGLKMAEDVGASLVGTESFYGHIQYREAMTDERFWPYPVLDSLATAGVVLNSDGERFCDEGLGGVYVTNAIAKLADPLSAVILFDDAIWNGPGTDWLLPANPFLLNAGGKLISAPTIEQLAAQLSLPADKLRATIDGYNSGVAAGQMVAAPPRTTSPYKPWPVAKGPFHAIPVCAGVTYTMGGIATNAKAQVLSQGGAVIPGLLAAGATTGGLEGFSFSGYSGGLSKSSVFGLIAGDTLAETLSGTARAAQSA
ncbi:MAG: hypothetical protein JWO51_4949 [Rhodospirillales bacterium]|nr:hypothetical protein [Rhodospirillales bacterium]